MAEQKEQKGGLSERNRRFLEDWKKAQEAYGKLPPEEQAEIQRQVQELWDKATLNGRIE